MIMIIRQGHKIFDMEEFFIIIYSEYEVKTQFLNEAYVAL